MEILQSGQASGGKAGEGASAASKTPRVCMLYGTADQFTGVGAFRSLVAECEGKGLKGWEVAGADHFFRSEAEGADLERGMSAWIDDSFNQG